LALPILLMVMFIFDLPHLALGKSPSFTEPLGMSQRHIDVRYVANLARLELSDEEVAIFQPQLEAILGHVEALSKLDVSGLDSTSNRQIAFGKMRDDVPHESLSQAAMLQNAPDQSQGQIRVPKVVTDA
jgi:aspartyl-tRNA(Asn)/glutamyl-tRNA(Gln) amidotransferase subunit C